MDDRVTYSQIREWVFDCYYSYCQLKLRHSSGWVDGELEIGYAYDELESSFDYPVENLMLEVLVLILGAGRLSDYSDGYHRSRIDNILKENKISDLISVLSGDELEQFKVDLSILKVN